MNAEDLAAMIMAREIAQRIRHGIGEALARLFQMRLVGALVAREPRLCVVGLEVGQEPQRLGRETIKWRYTLLPSVFGGQGSGVGEAKVQPPEQVGIIAMLFFHMHKAAELSRAVDDGFGRRISQRLTFLCLAHPKHEPPDAVFVTPRAAQHVSIQEEAQPAHHPFLGYARIPGQSIAHTGVEDFIHRHQATVPSCQRIVRAKTDIVTVVSPAPIARPWLFAEARRLK